MRIKNIHRHSLRELIKIKNGKDHKNLKDGNIPVFGSGGIMRFADKAIYNDESILLPRKGTLSNIQYVNKPFWTVDTIYYTIVNKKLANVYYLFNYLKMFDLSRLNSGTGVPSMTFDAYYNLEVYLPDLPTQQKIAAVLSSLDSKIELNNRINAELEAMAKTLYDYWFVQFDFPCLPSDYRPSGQVNPDSELISKIKAVCTYRQTGGLPLPDGKKWFVYVILCEDDSFYKGMTNDLYRRYYEHCTKQGADWTKVHTPKKIIHYEEFNSQNEAAIREKELKTGYGRTWLQREYEKYLKHKNGSPAPECKLRMAGKMVWNDELKRDIPAEWGVGKLDDVVTHTGTGLNPRENFSLGYGNNYYVTIKNIKQGKVILDSRCDKINNEALEIINKRSDLMIGDILFTSIEPVGITYLILQKPKNWNINESVFTIRPNYKKVTSEFLYMFLSGEYIKSYTRNVSAGSIHKGIRHSTLKECDFILPLKTIIDDFSKILSPILNQLDLTQIENQKLTELRDWLLPMLMNGQVKVE